MDKATRLYIISGLIGSALLMLPLLAHVHDFDFPLRGLLSIPSVGADYMITLFHEIGHAIFFWAYGYIALPVFDFMYGGGVTIPLTPRLWPVQLAVFAMLAGLMFIARRDRAHLVALGALCAFLLLTCWSEDVRMTVILFMGTGAVMATGGFLLWRALMNCARSGVERFLNMLFGFFMIFSEIHAFYNLLSSDLARVVYSQQKGGDHKGDLSRITQIFDVTMNGVCVFGLVCCAVALILPFLLFWWHGRYEEIDLDAVSASDPQDRRRSS